MYAFFYIIINVDSLILWSKFFVWKKENNFLKPSVSDRYVSIRAHSVCDRSTVDTFSSYRHLVSPLVYPEVRVCPILKFV
jgi:hypothetical protein